MIEVKYKRAEVQKNRIIIPVKYIRKFDRFLKMEIDYSNGEIIISPENKGGNK